MFRIMRGVIRLLLAVLGGVVGYQLAGFILADGGEIGAFIGYHPVGWVIFFVFFFALVGFMLTPVFWMGLGKMGQLFEANLQGFGFHEILISLMGLTLGLVLANLIALPLSRVPVVGVYLAVLINVALGYLGVRLSLRRRDDIWAFFSSAGSIRGKINFRSKKSGQVPKAEVSDKGDGYGYRKPKVLDTSILIDGRISDIVSTGFIEGPLILPRFVLSELQGVADSSDPIKRARGRRGLDVVNRMQQHLGDDLRIMDVPMKELERDVVDEAIVALAKRIDGCVLTTDYNLNKIAQIEGVSVLNVNDLSNALKPMLLPGENIRVDVIREGKEPNQGVGYLEDGTMIVVEDGQRYIGSHVDVVVTSMLQTSAGRMIFARIRR
ncbi:integral membrane protein (PIN domain superfamily) [Thermanaerovibrio velox DSM 12556]|uniref:Integral membrane protein (PIN domain superfamily) n=1 Tax=Thermanaerovibrio velox DSM 12556 TaxID=926567 RepID=H0URK7_9BACT|nr:PIN domain-containing protein [Thermanaerovibrio velox]EHM09946.1 integral membrane protein (PIN domain superfamily) [Thermanaerovibrio velox DSM 12556]